MSIDYKKPQKTSKESKAFYTNERHFFSLIFIQVEKPVELLSHLLIVIIIDPAAVST